MAEEIFSKKVAFWDVLKLVAVLHAGRHCVFVPLRLACRRPHGGGKACHRTTSFSPSGPSACPRASSLRRSSSSGMAFSLVSFVMNDYFMPLGNLRFAEIYRRILYSNPAAGARAILREAIREHDDHHGGGGGPADQRHPDHRQVPGRQPADDHRPGTRGWTQNAEQRRRGLADPGQGLHRAQLPARKETVTTTPCRTRWCTRSF